MVAQSFAGLELSPSTSAKPDAMRVLLFGAPGSGKTYAASTIAQTGPTLYIDMVGERGQDSFRGTPWEKNIEIIRPKSVTELSQIHKALVKDEHYSAVILDSLSAAQKSTMRWVLGYDEDAVAEMNKGKSGPTMQAWGKVLEAVTDLCTFYMSLADSTRKSPKHVIFTAQEKEHEDYEGNGRLYPDVSKGSRAIAMATPNIVGYCGMDAYMNDEGAEAFRHIITLGPSTRYATKARIPANATVPSVIGVTAPVSLYTLGKAIGSIS